MKLEQLQAAHEILKRKLAFDAQKVRDEALEEAAIIAESTEFEGQYCTTEDCSAAALRIRALKSILALKSSPAQPVAPLSPLMQFYVDDAAHTTLEAPQDHSEHDLNMVDGERERFEAEHRDKVPMTPNFTRTSHQSSKYSDFNVQNCWALWQARAALQSQPASKGDDQTALGVAREALRFYANGEHFTQHQDVWDTVSGEPPNFYEDENNTATVEDGSVAKMALEDIALASVVMFPDESPSKPQLSDEDVIKIMRSHNIHWHPESDHVPRQESTPALFDLMTMNEARAILQSSERDKDKISMDWLESAVENGHVSMCFEMDDDGGVHLTLDPVGGEQIAYRHQNTIREAIRAAIAASATTKGCV